MNWDLDSVDDRWGPPWGTDTQEVLAGIPPEAIATAQEWCSSWRRSQWMPARPPRRMPGLWAIASYWSERGVFEVDLDWPHCFGCEDSVPRVDESTAPRARWLAASRYLDRAHLVDHWCGGLDGPQNIVPLCIPCHKFMPTFRVGDGPDAIEWVLDGGGIHAEMEALARAMAAEGEAA